MGARLALLSTLAAVGASGCVDPFSGSNVQIDFASATPAAARPGATPAENQPPANTYMSLYAVEEITDDTGTVVQNALFEVQRFEIRSLIDTSSPCFIDIEGAPFPGIHVTEYFKTVALANGVDPTDPLHPPGTVTENQRIDVLTARQRAINLGNLEGQVKAVASYSLFRYGAVATACDDPDPNLIPPTTCTGDGDNAKRLRLCKEEWRQDPFYYEGSDKVFTLPLNGTFYGVVIGVNPINMGQLAGSSFFVDEVLDRFQSFNVSWQYKDLNDDGAPDFPAPAQAAQDCPSTPNSPTGCILMAGRIEHRTRGVINVHMVNPVNPEISAEMSIFSDLADDHVSF